MAGKRSAPSVHRLTKCPPADTLLLEVST